MFEALETGKALDDSEFAELELPLREQLLDAQFELVSRERATVIVVAGLDGAGKGALVHRLNEWMDPRRIETNTFWERSDEEESRPFFWRFWRALPARGRIGVFLGSWYTRPAQDAILHDTDEGDLLRQCDQINTFERMLADDGAVVIKLWLHISEAAQRRLLEARHGVPEALRDAIKPYELRGGYRRAIEVAERIVLQTDTSASPWHLIEAEDGHYRDIRSGELILARLREHIDCVDQAPAPSPSPPGGAAHGQPTVLDTVDLSRSLKRERYREKLAKYQARLHDLTWQAYAQRLSLIAVFEGWDAAGKGSAIRRVTRAIDPRLFYLSQSAAPTDEERAHHYLWRFWRHIQRDGRATLFDRSWYGRVLVERVEGFAREEEWQRAYGEINQFEEQLVDHGSVLVKFWLHISPQEQLKRFREREEKPHKQYKITDDDWRNRERWNDYEQAVDQMVTRTSTHHAPWTLIAGDDKKDARVQILKRCCRALQQALER